MALVDRLILREILVPLAVGILAIVQLLVILQLLQLNQIVFGSAVTLGDLGRLTVALAPHFLVVALPLAFMLGVQLGIGRLSSDRELLAMSAAGVPPLRFYRVPIAISLALGVAVAALVHWAEPWGFQELNRVLNQVIKRNLQSGLTPGLFNDGLPRFMIYVGGQEHGGSGLWKGVLIEDEVGDGAPLLALAEGGRVEDTGGDALMLHLFKGEIHRSEPRGETVARFDEGTFVAGVQAASKNRFSNNEIQLSNAVLRQRVAELERRGGDDDRDQAARMRLELVRRWAIPFACFVFAILGVPLATGARGSKSSAYLITMGAFVSYYALSRVAVALTVSGWNAWAAGLIPNALILIAGLLLTLRTSVLGIGKPQ
ncbi:MAG: YjgP/YjgQ family permease [Deltaproteobacteria bacterium]|nr:MAG: YjgP/YjgQ family permease [Deltaproteobacteria bacterium]